MTIKKAPEGETVAERHKRERAEQEAENAKAVRDPRNLHRVKQYRPF